MQSQVNELWRTVPQNRDKEEEQKVRFPSEPQRTFFTSLKRMRLYLGLGSVNVYVLFVKVSQYFYPQKQTQVMNVRAGAAFWHYTILNHRPMKA
ncbi:SpoVR family protein [Vibrio chagasii]|nr:SpoVR family protein [Vibrio chagasii]